MLDVADDEQVFIYCSKCVLKTILKIFNDFLPTIHRLLFVSADEIWINDWRNAGTTYQFDNF